MELISIKLSIDIKKLNRILTLEQLPDEDLLKEDGRELCSLTMKEHEMSWAYRI